MTVEDEKGYEIAEKYLRKKYGDDYVDFIETEGQSYLDGYEQGYEDCRHYAHNYYKPKWHDLRKDPNDLPRRSKITDLSIPVLLSNKTISYYSYEGKEWRCVENGRKQSLIIAWCELPMFEE